MTDRAIGIPNSARLLAHLLAVTATWCVGRWLTAMPGPAVPTTRLERVARNPGLGLAAMIALTALWFIGPRGVTEANDYVARYGTSPAVLASRLIFCGYLGLMGSALCHRLWAYRQAARRRLTRVALTLQTVGWASAVLYLAHEGGYAITRYLQGPYSADRAERAQDLLIAGATLPITIGRALPPLTTRLARAQRWLLRYRAYRQIEPLARAMPADTPIPPSLAEPSRLHDTLPIRDLDLLLHFRAMRIRDGAGQLSGRITPALFAQAQQYANHCAPTPDPAALDGACIALALHAPGGTPPGEDGSWQPGGPSATDLTSEAIYLRRVTRAWQAVRADLADPDPTAHPPTTEHRRMNTPPTPRDRLARALTEILAPWSVAATALCLIAWHSAESPGAAIRWGLLALVFAPAAPLLYLIRQVHRRAVTDRHVPRREQRPPVLIASGIFMGIGVALLAALGAPPALSATLGAAVIALGVALAVTLVWKISLHVGIVAGAVVALVQLIGPPMLALAPLVVAIAWARVHLRAHTPAQVLAGAAIGALTTAVSLGPLLDAVS